MPERYEPNLTPNETVWAKFGHIDHFYLVGKDGYCFGSGCNILLINLRTMEEVLLTCNNIEMGEGIDCFIGHRNLNVFAYSEALIPPRVFVRSFMDLQVINMLEEGSEHGYHCMVFSESDYFIALGKYPDFVITVWNWRTGEKMASVKSSLSCDKQMIKCNHNYQMPLNFAHIGLFTADLSIWDLFLCGKKMLFMEHKVRYRNERSHIAGTDKVAPPFFTNGFWTADGGFFITNSEGNVFTVSIDYYLDEIITSEAIGRGPTYLCWFEAGIITFGPDEYFRHYKKSGAWILQNKFKSDCKYKKLISTRGAGELLGLTTQHDIRMFDTKLRKFVSTGRHEYGFSDVCMIYPSGKHIVTLAHNKEIACWELESGKRVDSLLRNEKILSIVENPEYPYIAVGYMSGLLELISLYKPNKMKVMASFLLSDRPISQLYFTDIGKLLVTCDTYTGQFFIIEGKPGSKMHVIATVDAHHQIADYILVASKTCLRLFAIFVTSEQYIAGNRLVRFCITSGSANAEAKDYNLENPNEMFSRLCATTRPNRDRVFYAMPFSKRAVYEIETKRGDSDARIIRRHNLGHQMRKIRLHLDAQNTVSCGYDGLVMLHSHHLDDSPSLVTIMPHHRMLCGVRTAFIDPMRRYVLSFGRDRSMVCTKLLKAVEVEEGLEKRLQELMGGTQMEIMFKNPTEGFSPKGELAGKTWLEAERINNFHNEKLQCQDERNEILAEFSRIQEEAQLLLTENIEGPTNELLDYQDFNLDVKLKDKLTAESKDLCKRTKAYLEQLIIAQDKVKNWIKKYCWDDMEVHGKAIWAIFGNFDVQNYVLLPALNQDEERLQLVKAIREIEFQLADDDTFEPWIPMNEIELEKKMKQLPNISGSQEVANIGALNEDEEEKFDEETFTAFAGSIAHTFITIEKGQYDQYQMQSYHQSSIQTSFIQKDKITLKEYLNKEFEKLMSMKVREMNFVSERNTRLRHILSELNYFNDNKYQVLVNDPEWRQTENPEQLLKVEPNEVAITPYISPSGQAILDAKAAEEERIRLLLLADDFKERALMAMMNGVLEIRWEDELRKEVPIPACMIEKEPENYIVEDLQAIREYEEKCKFLASERERYRQILEAEYAKLGNSLRESVKKFNGRLSDLMILKIRVDAAVQQENLKINRLLLNNLQRYKLNQTENKTLRLISEAEQKIEDLNKIITILHENLADMKNYFELVLGKEKMIEKAFKRDFADATPVVQDVVNKLYKKRPKTNVRNITSVAILIELTKCMMTRKTSLILNTDALDFLKSMDALDSISGIPNVIDELVYNTVCKIRRQKIEAEVKIKALQMEISDADTTLSIVYKQLALAKEHLQKLNHEISNIRKQKILQATDMKVQLVLKEGYVEVPTNGRLSDYDDVMLVSRREVENINKIILNAGQRKLKAMRDNMNFHRVIMITEWKHKRMKMRIEDLRDYFDDIESVKVTKEIQAFLKARARGETQEKVLSFEQEIEMVRKSYERVIVDKKMKVRELQRMINALKKDNSRLDQLIADVNVDVCEYQCEVDQDLEKREQEVIKIRTATLLKRSKLVKEIQENHNEILVLQTELELLRLRTFPTLKFKVID